MHVDVQPVPRPRKYRFSLGALLAIVTVVALAFGAWKSWTYESPTNRIAEYEKAEGTRRNWFDVGPNRVSLAMIARNDRDGTLHVEDGDRHAAPKSAVSDAATISSAGPWLDVAEMSLAPGPEQIDIIEARVFDHKTRTLISELNPAYGWRVVGRSVVQLYGLGRPLPDRVDLWFRLSSYEAKSPLAKLDPSVGPSYTLGGAQFAVRAIRSGRCGYSLATGLTSPDNEEEGSLSLLLSQQGGDLNSRYQIVAVSHTGETTFTNTPHFLRPQKLAELEPLFFDIGLTELHHFEIRPFGGREKFFFDAVELPKTSRIAFAPPPTAKVSFNGEPVQRTTNVFAPLRIQLATFRGREFGGVSVGLQRANLIRSPGLPSDPKKEFTVAYWTQGLGPTLWKLGYIDSAKWGAQAQNNRIGKIAARPTTGPLTPGQLQGFSRSIGGGGRYGAASVVFPWPLERLGDVEITLAAPVAPKKSVGSTASPANANSPNDESQK